MVVNGQRTSKAYLRCLTNPLCCFQRHLVVQQGRDALGLVTGGKYQIQWDDFNDEEYTHLIDPMCHQLRGSGD